MAHQFPSHHQPQPMQMPPHHQNIGQQRQTQVAQQQVPAMGQQRAMQGQQPLHGPMSTFYDPQFVLFTFEKPKGADSWEDVEAEQQHIKAEDLHGDVKKFQRNKKSVLSALNKIPSTNCRRLINELVEDENHKLLSKNRALQWNIASIDVEWKKVGRGNQQIKRMSVILQTGPSGFEETSASRNPATMAAKPQPMQAIPGLAQQSHQQGLEMSQPLRNLAHPAQASMGHPQQPQPPPRMPPQGQAPLGSQAQPRSGQLPPPPPPPSPPPAGVMNLPPTVHGAPQFPNPSFPPPPPGQPHEMLRPPVHGQQNPRVMPGTFPDTLQRPTMRPGQPNAQYLDPSDLRRQKKTKGRQDELSSESELDSEEWESETGDSASDHLRIRHVERGEFAHIGRPQRGRSRQSSRAKKSRHNNSHSGVRSRSRSRVHTESKRRRRDSGYVDSPPTGQSKYSSISSKDNSPRSSKQQLPPNIHIHMNSTAAEKQTQSTQRVRSDNHGTSSPKYKKDKYTAEPMSRGNSWDRHSGTASLNDNSSIRTADDSVFSEPDRHGRRSRHASDIVEQSPRLHSRNLSFRTQSFGHPHPSNIYDEVERRPRRSAYHAPDDYPRDQRQRNSYFDEQAYPQPSVYRRNSAQTPQSNPFDTTRFPPRLPRANTYGPETHESVYGQPRHLSERAGLDSLQLHELFDAIEHLNEQKKRPLHGRRASEYNGTGTFGAYEPLYRRGY